MGNSLLGVYQFLFLSLASYRRIGFRFPNLMRPAQGDRHGTTIRRRPVRGSPADSSHIGLPLDYLEGKKPTQKTFSAQLQDLPSRSSLSRNP
jgi:hypothetical protein